MKTPKNRLLRRIFFYYLTTVILSVPGLVQAQHVSVHTYSDSIRIDKIEYKGNWITWDFIIQRELEFKEGECTSFGDIETSMKKVWNIGNFANVDYKIDSVDGLQLITITALDGINFYPIIAIDHSSEDDYSYTLGFADKNFLGLNANLDIGWIKKPFGTSWDFRISLPRQMLYKNMTLGLGFNTGNAIGKNMEREIFQGPNGGVDSVKYIPTMLAPHRSRSFSIQIGNPWQEDYEYHFSPNLGISYTHHLTDMELLPPEDLELDVHLPPYDNHFIGVSISESIGTVDRKRHRKNGYSIGAGLEMTIGLSPESPNFQNISLSAEYHETFNKIFQLSTWYRTGFTNARDPYRFILGSGSVLGLRHGEIYGKAHYSAYLGAHFTWLNQRWISLENAWFFNFGAGADQYFGMYGKKPFMAVGTSFDFRIPMASFMTAKFTFMYAGPGTEWFKFNM